MKVTLIGHASVLVELDGARCLMDPVFQDPFEEGAVTSCPRREVFPARLPPIDVLILSHSHLDHFDIPTLAQLPRSCQVLCPKDHVLTYVLQQFGFTKINAAEPMTHLQLGTYDLLTTHSNVTNVVEFGVVFKDRSGVFWNQVDTVLAPKTIQAMRKKFPRIDLMFAMYASQNFGFFDSKGAGFPHAMHQMNLNTVREVQPRVAVPGSAGFRFCGPFAWANSFLFPVSRERFVRDLARVAPGVRTHLANPGDVFEIGPDGVAYQPAASELVRMVEDDTALLRYDPGAPVPPLTDPNPEGRTAKQLEHAVTRCFEELAAFVRGAWGQRDEVLDEYRRLRTSYAVEVVLPDGALRCCRIGFGEQPEFLSGTVVPEADVVHSIAASALFTWQGHHKSYFYLRGFSRKRSSAYEVSSTGQGVSVTAKAPRDLLEYYLNRKAKGAEMAVKDRLDQQLRPYVQQPRRSL